MKNYDYGYGRGYKPVSAWGYIGFNVLYAIPVIGWVILIYNALFSANKNVRNFARSYFCALLLTLIIVVVLAVAFYIALTSGALQPVIDYLIDMGIIIVG